jgi:hypothetical protein
MLYLCVEHLGFYLFYEENRQMEAEVKMVEVGGKQYPVVKTGRAQAEQVVQVTRWISRHGVKAVEGLQSESGEVSFDSYLSLFGMIIERLTADALIDLFVTLVGCTKAEAEEHFDVATLLDAAFIVYEEQPAVRRLLTRFFSQSSSGTES